MSQPDLFAGLAPAVPEYVSMKQALEIVGRRLNVSVASLKEIGVHKRLGEKAAYVGVQFRPDGSVKARLRRVPVSHVERVLDELHKGMQAQTAGAVNPPRRGGAAP
jgi:hypothetical protein